MFEKFDFFEKELIFIALKKLIESNSGEGFHNADQGHPIYLFGAEGESMPGNDNPDSPDKNELFIMLSELSKEFKENH